MAERSPTESSGETEKRPSPDFDLPSTEDGRETPEDAGQGADSGVAASPKEAESSWKMRGNPVSDLSTEHDTLGFSPYVDAIAAFLKNEDTKPPLTMSIEGEWGTGKSSFMRQLQVALDKPPPLPRLFSPYETSVHWSKAVYRRWRVALQPKPRPARLTFWFNAWRCETRDAMWATFALSIPKNLRIGQNLPRRILGDVKLAASRIETLGAWLHTLGVLLLWLIVALGAAGAAAYPFNLKPQERAQLTQKILVYLTRTIARGVGKKDDQSCPACLVDDQRDRKMTRPHLRRRSLRRLWAR